MEILGGVWLHTHNSDFLVYMLQILAATWVAHSSYFDLRASNESTTSKLTKFYHL